DISTDVDFYMVGLKPNSSRLSLKFIYKRKVADILINIAEHQKDMQISEEINPVPFWVIKKELLSPNSTNSAVNPALISKIFESAIYGTEYPTSLLSTIIQRAKIDKNTDRNKKIDIRNNSTRAGIIKACLNRKSRIFNKKEEIKVALDKENKNPAYLCGRLFAVLEKLQQDASNNSLNTTIKDAYFSSAVSKPAIIFPKILKLAQSHIKKSEHSTYYNILIGEIIDDLKGEFPETLLLNDQGRFIIGYYQQYQNFFVKKENKEEE
ncbi:MAG TPA: type I-C CRISPR-associated protein Cas8c/Csd1, partial [Candidatus Fimicola cottocaccae]|nr:type I-C CRISPR-associated protein Cas8c/Csd1 [Candidatus Fimicola cottocaccae]